MAIDRADAYIGTEPDSAAAAVKLARRRSAKAVFDIHEVYDQEVLTRWSPGPTRKLMAWHIRRWLRSTCRQCDLVIGVNEEVLAPYGELSTPRLLVRNCAPLAFADGPPAGVFGQGRSDPVVMHGLTAVAQGTVVVMRAMGLVRRIRPQARLVLFDYLDRGVNSLSSRVFNEVAAREGIMAVIDLRNPIPMVEMPGVLRSCDIGMVAYDRVWGVRSLPNKLFEYMAAGLPIIAPDYAREIAPIIRQEQCGLLVDTEDPQAIADAILELANEPEKAREMGRRGREGFIARHNFDSEARPLLERIRRWAEEG
jgi:glycosyltransferase involved in cell wall biosynthesis